MNFLKDFGVGVLAISAIVLATKGIIYAPTLFGFSEEVGGNIFLAIVGLYIAWVFGGLTRSIYFKEKS